jgi:hypothetical protein
MGGNTVPLAAIVKQLSVQDDKIDAMTQQTIHLGIFMQFIVEQLADINIVVDTSNFAAYAQEKWQELREANTARVDDAVTEMQENTPDAATTLGVDLDG